MVAHYKLDLGNNLDNEELLDSQINEVNKTLNNDFTRLTSRQDPEYPLLNEQAI
jgi:hypothetical protein